MNQKTHSMGKARAVLAILLLALRVSAASAVEVKAGEIRPFAQNELTVSAVCGGTLTVEAASGTIPLENAVTDLPVKAGTTTVLWEGLTFSGEPLTRGKVTLHAVLKRDDGQVEESYTVADISAPVPAMLCCLPAQQRFYADGKNQLRVECAVSAAGACVVTAAPKDNPEEIVWRARVSADAKAPFTVKWNGVDGKHRICGPGQYIISAWTERSPQRVQTAEVTLLAEPLPEPELAVTGPLIPEDLSDDAAVWEALTSPVTVGDGPEGRGLLLCPTKRKGSKWNGTVSCRTTGVRVLEICGDGWAKVAAWRQSDGQYTEGYVKASSLRVIRPNDRYGAVVDKKAQTMTIYEDGKKIGTVLVSTGLTTGEDRSADTHSGVFLLGTRMETFNQDGYTYCYPIRIDGPNLIHQAGYLRDRNGRDFTEEIALLGSKASHGCIRVDPRITEENNGINSWWIWTHMGRDTKIIVMPED